jgi:hypothetical protein
LIVLAWSFEARNLMNELVVLTFISIVFGIVRTLVMLKMKHSARIERHMNLVYLVEYECVGFVCDTVLFAGCCILGAQIQWVYALALYMGGSMMIMTTLICCRALCTRSIKGEHNEDADEGADDRQVVTPSSVSVHSIGDNVLVGTGDDAV